jgi:hypothetical protein
MPLPLLARKLGPWIAVACVATLLAVGCGDSNSPPTTGEVTLQLDHSVGNDSLLLHVERYTNAAGNHYDINELRYYISNVALVRADASLVPLADVVYRDLAESQTRLRSVGGVPNGDYTGVRFTFGLDAQRNVDGGLPVSFENGLMVWPDPLGGGYHFMQLDGRHHGGGTGWQAHLGRLDRPTDPVPIDPHFEVQLDFASACGSGCALHLAGDRWTVQLVMDVNKWFEAPNLFDFDVFGSDVMSNPTAQRELGENGVHVFHLGGIAPTP